MMLALLSLVSVCGSIEPQKETSKALHFSHVMLPEGRRIAGISIFIYGARVSALHNIPPDWQLSLELDGSHRAQIRGNCQHGVGGLNHINELDRLIIAESANWNEAKVEGIVYVTKDFDKLEEIKIDSSQIEFQTTNLSSKVNASSSK